MVVRLSASRAGRPLPPGRFLVLIFVKDSVDPRAIMRLEGLGQLKNPVTSSGIEPAAFRLVASCLNQLRYSVTLSTSRNGNNRIQTERNKQREKLKGTRKDLRKEINIEREKDRRQKYKIRS
jgi:hypothetical protein